MPVHGIAHPFQKVIVQWGEVGQPHHAPRLFWRTIDLDRDFHGYILLMRDRVATSSGYAFGASTAATLWHFVDDHALCRADARRRRTEMTATISIPTADDATMPAYWADPATSPVATVVVIQEIFGVNAGVRRKCDTLAEAGFRAIAPDLFWRIEPGIELDPDVASEMQRGLDLMSRFDQDQAIRDIEATIRYARSEGTEAIGAVGYCLGGRLAYMTAARTDVDVSVGYYAVGIDGLLNEKHAIAHPLMLHIAGDDGFVDKDAQAAIHAGLDDHPKVILHDYAGEDHGFATEFGNPRSDAAARLADERTAAFLREHLG